MGKIQVLPKSIAEKIAAGEVVERPASVIKELVENSIDAGADKITIEINHGGIMYMRVTDNGSGIKKEDIKTAFLRHATSKISTQTDLDSISTLGFRGEALAAICAVSKVEVLTFNEQDDCGTQYVIEGGEEKSFLDTGCPKGTTIIVRDLFYNTPARMKFLKKDVTEANAVAALIDRIALSHPDIAFNLIRDGKKTLSTAGNGDLKSAIYSVLGRDYTNGLIPVNNSLQSVSVSGYISKPVFCKSSRSGQFFFLNGRLVKSLTAMAALEQAYKNSIMVGKFPSCVINICVPFEFVDVNVHPAKTEVRFADEKTVFDCIYFSVKTALTQGDTRPELNIAPKNTYTPQIKTEQYTQTNINLNASSGVSKIQAEKYVPQEKVAPAKSQIEAFTKMLADINTDAPLENKPTVTLNDSAKDFSFENKNITISYEEPKKKVDVDIVLDDKQTVEEQNNNYKPVESNQTEDEVPIKYIGEAFSTYIIVERADSIFVIDKHAAHERILFNKLKKQEVSEQMLLSSKPVNLTKEEYDILINNMDVLSDSGFEIEDFGGSSVVVRSLPSILTDCDIPLLLTEIAKGLKYGNKVLVERMDDIYHTMSCKAAIKAGMVSGKTELEQLAKAVLNDKDVLYCPHGRPVAFEITNNQLKKQFGRIN